jgi:alanyl-tRNA synthetase
VNTTVMSAADTVRTFIEFFTERGHRQIAGSSLLPPDGDAVLFTTSGMHPLTPFLEGRPHPLGSRLVGMQRCLRTTDLDEVGDSTHLTVFEMLGSWSLSDYAGPQSLRWAYELVRDGFGVCADLLHATVFGGDGQLGPDTDLLRTWGELGVPVELTEDENWWSNGPTGLCGPDSELFIWTGTEHPSGTPGTDDRWMELWNHVMLRYRRHDDGSLEPLQQASIDTGMGLERLLMVLQGKRSVFECDVFEPWMTTLRALWSIQGSDLRVIGDHLRASAVIIGDGVRPSNTGRGYVLRRLVRRALSTMWRTDSGRTLADLPDQALERTFRQFGQQSAVTEVRAVLVSEERRFADLLNRGRKVLSRYRGPLTQDDLRYLHETHGLPRDLVTDLLSAQPEPPAPGPTP